MRGIDRFGAWTSRDEDMPGSRPAAAATERTVSATAIASNTGSAKTTGARPMNSPWVAAAKIRVAPASRQRRAARCKVPPVLIKSSRMIAAQSRTSPTGRSPVTTPPARRFRQMPLSAPRAIPLLKRDGTPRRTWRRRCPLAAAPPSSGGYAPRSPDGRETTRAGATEPARETIGAAASAPGCAF